MPLSIWNFELLGLFSLGSKKLFSFRNDLIDLVIDEMKKSTGDVVTVNGEAKQFESEFEADAAMNTDNIKAGNMI